MQRLPGVIVIGILASAAAFGQSAPPPRFEVASVKATGGGAFSTRPDRTAGRLRWTTQLCYLIGYAYQLDFSLVSGKCGSIYSVEATFDPAATDDQVRLMVQSLLTDRFKLRTHRVTTEADGYAMTIGKGGLKIKEASATDEPGISAIFEGKGVILITSHAVPLSQLATTLQRSTRIPVWDRTSLSGNYSFALRYSPDLSADSSAAAPLLTTAIQETLGLRLEKQKGTVESLVIDSVEEPSEN